MWNSRLHGVLQQLLQAAVLMCQPLILRCQRRFLRQQHLQLAPHLQWAPPVHSTSMPQAHLQTTPHVKMGISRS